MRTAVLTLALAAGLCGLAPTLRAQATPSAATAAQGALPSDPQGVVDYVKAALRDRDEAAVERLVNWDGVRLPRKRLTLFQIRTTFGRPIREMAVEDFPADGLAEVEARGTFKPNMAVTKRLRIVFDEDEGRAEGTPPTNVFLLGEKDGAYRIAVLNAVSPPGGK
ncbi:hypothetical protein [Methylobacterium sp. J-076]|uniref:hypothetical protein n=1 Tax=Methylobacterium sp. J-076 TaxID=2836655 RepID=UPI001FB957ED|nr:hypothetical protein [Methylobacterium sp. J-076]MCJ2014775.1 hypothetical protein [Methylobacterium sp. J-076]